MVNVIVEAMTYAVKLMDSMQDEFAALSPRAREIAIKTAQTRDVSGIKDPDELIALFRFLQKDCQLFIQALEYAKKLAAEEMN